MDKRKYKKELRQLQIELVKLQRHIICYGHRILVIIEGRDASGKDGTIKRITQHLSPRETRVVALGNPSEHENKAWYFQRYVAHLPVEAEMVFFNRSWYNRAGVERVMGYCTDTEYKTFMDTVNDFEDLLIKSGINLLKYYLDISREEQKRRLADRKKDPLKQWKISPVDQVAIKKWNAYSKARNDMFTKTSTKLSPWFIVKADNKKETRLNLIRDILSRVDCPDKEEHLCLPDTKIVFKYQPSLLKKSVIAT